MKVLVVGSGGREHSMCWSIAQSKLLTKLYCAPGNAGIAEVAECVPINAEDIEMIVEFSTRTEIDLVVVGPEVPLVMGLVDRLEEEGIKAFGPNARAAILEGSKVFMKELCSKNNIPTAKSSTFTMSETANAFIIKSEEFPIVIKADGLAAGKGVFIAHSIEEGLAAINEIEKYGTRIIIEEFLEGEEVSYFVLIDKETILPLTSAQDHKHVGEGDVGLNTGGMGAYSPAPIFTSELRNIVLDKIIIPTIEGMEREGRPYRGLLYAGLMITEDGPVLLEYNIRFGDPECQSMLFRLKSDLLQHIIACCRNKLFDEAIMWEKGYALTVVMANKGYPERYEKGSEIKGLDKVKKLKDIKVFHAGTKLEDDKITAVGGRVLNITATGSTIAEAQTKAYEAIDLIDWPNGFYREDIGWRAVSVADRINRKIRNKLTLTSLNVINESYMHNVPKDSESHFKIVIVSNEFEGMTRIARHRIINEILTLEMKTIHALSIQAFTEVEWKERGETSNDSPLCRG